MTNKEDVYRNTTLDLDKIASQARACINEIVETSGISKGQVFVVGCSTSEICGDMIGSNSSLEVAKVVFGAIYEELSNKGIYLASQCCEHLNRAIYCRKRMRSFYWYEEPYCMRSSAAQGRWLFCYLCLLYLQGACCS